MSSVTVDFDTARREDRFKNPPRDKSAFPALQDAVAPHVESFNALTVDGGLLDLALQDIGEKVVYDGVEGVGQFGNKLTSMEP